MGDTVYMYMYMYIVHCVKVVGLCYTSALCMLILTHVFTYSVYVSSDIVHVFVMYPECFRFLAALLCLIYPCKNELQSFVY